LTQRELEVVRDSEMCELKDRGAATDKIRKVLTRQDTELPQQLQHEQEVEMAIRQKRRARKMAC